MFPGIDGFHWTVGHLIFLSIFYAVVLAIATTVTLAILRVLRDRKAKKLDAIRWQVDFHDLPMRDRLCRHTLTGEAAGRICDRGFDCRRCPTHAEILKQHPPREVGAEVQVAGLLVPSDHLYHRGHTWVRKEKDGTVTVGLDELGARVIGEPEDVELPPAGTRVAVNGTGWHMQKRGSDVRVLSPVDGEVIATGSPAAGWYLKVKPTKSGSDLRHLLRPEEAGPWLRRELERLQMALNGDGVSASLADGGAMVEDLSEVLPERDWEAICGEVFLQV